MLCRIMQQSGQLAVRGLTIKRQAKTIRAGKAAFSRLQTTLSAKGQALRVSFSYVTGDPAKDYGVQNAQALSLQWPNPHVGAPVSCLLFQPSGLPCWVAQLWQEPLRHSYVTAC